MFRLFMDNLFLFVLYEEYTLTNANVKVIV